MPRNRVRLVAGLAFASLISWAAAAAAAESDLNLVPWPKAVHLRPGTLALRRDGRIAAHSQELLPLAKVLAEELARVARGNFTATLQPKPDELTQIHLQLEPRLQKEAYTLTVDDGVIIRGGNYAAVALGTVTFLQAVQLGRDGGAEVPHMAVADEPAVEYRGLLLDVARKYHSLANLRHMVQLCRLYKVRYLQLHLTDDQSFMFPSRAFPQLATKNEHGGKTYTREELLELVAYADARNVTLIPEYEVPGHSAAANRALPDLFKIKGTKPYEHHASINFAKDEVMKAIETIVGEMCEVFRSSPYFHIGGDEADLEFAHQNADFQAAFKKHNLPNQHQLYRKFVGDMNEIVKKHGKRMLVWEGFGREPTSPVPIPKDITVLAYEIRFYQPDALVQDGYRVINASWTPLYVVGQGRPPAEIYAWNLHQFKPYGAKPEVPGVLAPRTGGVIGAQFCAWEQSESQELPNERLRLPAMIERIWNPEAGKTYADFARRLAVTDRLLDTLLGGPPARQAR